MGPDEGLKYAVLAMVCTQVVTSYLIRDAGWLTILVVSYVWGGVINHAMALAIHEISHNLAFGHQHPGRNRCLAIFGNLILGETYVLL